MDKEVFKEFLYDSIIIGGGPSGMTAALYLLRAGKKVLIIEKESFGGQINYSSKIENYPGISSISGPKLAMDMFDQIEKLGVVFEFSEVLEVDRMGKGFYVETTEAVYTSETIIFANGVKHRVLNLPKEKEYIGKGISFCSLCDGAFYKGKDVAVIGGGNTALREALDLSKICRNVYIIQNLDYLTGEEKSIKEVEETENIKIFYDASVEEYIVDKKIQGLKISCNEGHIWEKIPVSGVFLAIGLVPDNDKFKNIIELDSNGYIDQEKLTAGIFAAGDCRKKGIRQITTACSDGIIAAQEVCDYLGRKENND